LSKKRAGLSLHSANVLLQDEETGPFFVFMFYRIVSGSISISGTLILTFL